MAASSRLMIGEAERNFPVRIRIAVPPHGLGTRLDEITRANEDRQEQAKKPERSTYLARITKPDEDVDEMRKVFNSYVAARKKVGDDVSTADFEKFRGALVKQTRALIDSGKATAVSYRVEIADGKVAIKAKGEKE